MLEVKNAKKRPLIYRRFDGHSNSSYNAYMTAKNGMICTDNYFWDCKSENNSKIQTYGDIYLSVTRERNSGLESGHYVTSGVSRTYTASNRICNIGGATPIGGYRIKGDYTCAAIDYKVPLEKIDLNRTEKRKQSNTSTVSQLLNVNAISFRNNTTRNIANFNVYAKVFCLSAHNNTGPGHYVDNAGLIQNSKLKLSP